MIMKSGKSDLDIVEEQLHARSPIWPEVGQRIVLLGVEELNKVQTSSRNIQLVYTTFSNFTIFLFVVAIMLFLPDQGHVNRVI